MPSRSSPSTESGKAKPRVKRDVEDDAAEGADQKAAAKKAPGKKKEVLSLIEDEGAGKAVKKREPRKASTVLPPLGAKAAAGVTAADESVKGAKGKAKPEAEAPRKTLDQAKKEALNLFEEDDKPKVRRRPAEVDASQAPQSTALPPISLLKEQDQALAAAPPPPPRPEEMTADFELSETGEKIIHLKPPIVVKDLAEKLGVKPFKVIKDLINFKVFANPDKAIEVDIAEKVCELNGFKLERERREKGGGVHKVEEVVAEPPPPAPEEIEEEKLELRAPIITFMGHVDHGKTSLMDAIRKTQVVKGEAGGITQHIGAYSITHNGRPITFIDTPGHAAFSEMRARGANVTDIVVLVIAADDGIMPQTKEALAHARAAGVTLMVALNKIDVPGANVMRAKSQLQDAGLAPVDWGGSTECIEVSAVKGLGIDDLLETMALQAEVLELKADPRAAARATVIESSMVIGKGPVATVIVRQGTLKAGQPFICGPYWGKVKALLDDRGEAVKGVGPGMPAEVVGFSDMPNVGDELVVMDSERSVKRLSEERLEEIRQKKLTAPRRSSLETLFANIEDGQKKMLKVVLKADVQGSVEAISKCLRDIKSDKVNLEILHAEAGPVNESDVLLASASDAVILGFNVKVENKAAAVAKREGVQVKPFSIIYELIDQVKEAMLGMLDPLTRETILGHAKVKQLFKINRGRVAGCLVTDGRFDRKQRARIIRDGQAVYDGGIETLRRFQDEVGEVRNGLECGIKLHNFSEYEEGDVIECYALEKVAQTL